MKKYIFTFLLAVILTASCGLFKKQILIDGVTEEKARIDAIENPAMRYVINDQLRERKVELFDVVVKDVTLSTNIDYEFCVIVDVQTKKGTVGCYIYSSDVATISRLVRGKTRIDASGDFSRFFSLIGDYYTMLEMVKASIKIRG